MELTFYIWEKENAVGPFTLLQMRSIWKSGRIHMKSLVREDGGDEWKEAAEFSSIVAPKLDSNKFPTPQPVSVINLEMPFWSMVIFIIGSFLDYGSE